ncbi:MAG TPA: sigma-70 family RNA polymerase sigma factor, partial [Pyrinomonadaceae bacterium]|nr:sigma-70 family RNA polymerase sigma factor [Pyrinomonadaceae bacterium]
NLHRIKQPSQIQAWLVTTAKRETLQMIRRGKREVFMTADDSDDAVFPEISDEAALPDEVLLQLETQNRVRVALSSLDERCQNLLKMLFYEDKPPSYTEIATLLGISEGSIGPTRARCLQKLLSFL